MENSRKVQIKTEFITLGQMLKFVDLISSGSEQKMFIEKHKIFVDGMDTKMRGKKLYPGTKIKIDDSMLFEITKWLLNILNY